MIGGIEMNSEINAFINKRFYGVEDTCEIPQEEGKEWFHA